MRRDYENSVFINCPFDNKYLPIFRAIVFAVQDCGFIARSAQEADDSSQVRISKIMDVMRSSKYGIHDISRIELDRGTRYPRFNMPLELGIFLGAKEFGDRQQREKACLVLDSNARRYQAFMSDIAGQDIRAHENSPAGAVAAIREFFSTKRGGVLLPGPATMIKRYESFAGYLPRAARRHHLRVRELKFFELRELVLGFLRANPW